MQFTTSSADEKTRRPGRRGSVALAFAVACGVALIFGAWNENFRPDWLDRPVRLTLRTLRYVGVNPGLAVFDSGFQVPGRTRVVRARCLEVLGQSGEEPPELVYPEPGRCPTTGMRLQITPEEIFLTRMMLYATEDESKRLMEKATAPPPGRLTVAQALLPSVGYYFDQREKRRGTPRETLLFRYTHYVVDTETGENFEIPVVIFRVTIGAGPMRVAWFPSPQQVSRLWPHDGPP